MKRSELEKYLGKTVKVTLFNGDAYTGELHNNKGETIMNINLLQETVETLEQNGKSSADVEWVGIKNNSYYTWEEFEEQDKCVEYDADYIFEEIDRRLVVVGKDFWLERYEYDGSEWWEFKTLPTKPILKVDKLPILNEW